MPKNREKVLVTGCAGFVGFHVSMLLTEAGYRVAGIDNVNDYYEVSLKQARLAKLSQKENFSFSKVDIAETRGVTEIFNSENPDYVIHLAAQAGVRYSLDHPLKYAESNLTGFVNILESCRHHKVKHLVYASSSSVYGENKKVPFSTSDPVDKPISLYAATKRSNELMAYTYSHLFNIPTTGLRFFTVYGPWGRPDMAYFKFTKSIFEGTPIDVYNNGNMERDFTYVDDIAQGISKVMLRIPAAQEHPPYKLYNIGNNKPVSLGFFIETLEKLIGKQAQKKLLPMQPGDVPRTYADIDELIHDTGFKPETSIEEGLKRFVEWYKEYYKK
jgi:UDP-glucuronate 4-epimerase